MSDTQTHETLLELIRLFEGELAAVPFPDVDAATLRAARDAVSDASVEVERAEAELAEARQRLERMEQAFERTGRKALAYARVYAEEAPELGERLEALAARLAVKAPALPGFTEAPRKRGRPRKSEASLFGSGSAPSVSETAEAASA